MLIPCITNKIKSMMDKHFVYNYGKDLDRFIMAHKPQNNADVERLMFEYNNKQRKGL